MSRERTTRTTRTSRASANGAAADRDAGKSAAATADIMPDIEAEADGDAYEAGDEASGFEASGFRDGGDTFNLATLKEMSISNLTQIAKSLDVPGATGMRKQELIFKV